jgi:hypothetical protein
MVMRSQNRKDNGDEITSSRSRKGDQKSSRRRRTPTTISGLLLLTDS